MRSAHKLISAGRFGWFESRLVSPHIEAARNCERPNLILRTLPFAEANPIRSFFFIS